MKLVFYWDGLEETYEGETWKECCEECVSQEENWDRKLKIDQDNDGVTNRKYGRCTRRSLCILQSPNRCITWIGGIKFWILF